MAVTGHRSVDGVRAYKRISIDQEEDASKIIQRKKEKVDPPVKEERCLADVETKENDRQTANNNSNACMFNFSNCNVVINPQ